LADAYAVLNISADASDAEVKKAYRRLTSQHHPDKLVAKGLPEEMMQIAAKKTHEIRQAYEIIKEARGF
ncbi:DnaJ domain-containing protein, partial [Thiolapillus sp.]